MTRRDEALRLACTGQIVSLIGLLALAGVFVRALIFTPMDRLQGPAQKILYLHAHRKRHQRANRGGGV